MPNHVRNIVTFNCDEKKLKELLNAIKYESSAETEHTGIGTLDFSKIIPMPESLNIEAGSSTDRGLKAYRDFVYVYTLAGTREGLDLLNIPKEKEDIFLRARTDIDRGDFELGRTAFQNIEKYGAPTWYEWSIQHWGTKRNSYGYDQYDGSNTLAFNTAWSAPHPVLEKLAELYPDVVITHRWADEDLGNNCGERDYEGGELVGEHTDMSDKEALEFACEIWEYDLLEMGFALSSDKSRYIHTESEEYDLVEIFGQPALFSNGRFNDSNTPKGLYHYDLRESDSGDNFISIEPSVLVNRGGSVVMNEPLDFDSQGYISFTDDTSPNFLEESLTLRDFMDGNFEQSGGMKID